MGVAYAGVDLSRDGASGGRREGVWACATKQRDKNACGCGSSFVRYDMKKYEDALADCETAHGMDPSEDSTFLTAEVYQR